MVFCFFRRLVLLLLLLVFELAEVENFADRRIGVGRNLDQVESRIVGRLKRLVDGYDADLFAVGIYQAHASDLNILICPRPAFGPAARWALWVVR